MSFRDNLREALDYSGLEQKELAAKTEIPLKTIENYVKKDSSLPLADKAVKIAQALGVTVEYLVNGKAQEERNIVFSNADLRRLLRLLENLPQEKQKIVIKTALNLTEML